MMKSQTPINHHNEDEGGADYVAPREFVGYSPVVSRALEDILIQVMGPVDSKPPLPKTFEKIKTQKVIESERKKTAIMDVIIKHGPCQLAEIALRLPNIKKDTISDNLCRLRGGGFLDILTFKGSRKKYISTGKWEADQ